MINTYNNDNNNMHRVGALRAGARPWVLAGVSNFSKLSLVNRI